MSVAGGAVSSRRRRIPLRDARALGFGAASAEGAAPAASTASAEDAAPAGRADETGPVRFGLISDTHGLLRAEVFTIFRGVQGILHAGDVGDPAILDDLGAVAPVRAVWGNVDGWDVRARAREALSGTLAGLPFGLIHGHQGLGPEELAGRFPSARLVVHGHSHRPTLRALGAVLLVNPGSAGPKRFRDPVSVALLEVDGGEPRIRHLDLETGEPLAR